MNLADIEELERLLEAATPGPWEWDSNAEELYSKHREFVSSDRIIRRPFTSSAPHAEDRDVIVAAHNALPTLLRLARVALEVADEMRGHDGNPECFCTYTAEEWADRITQAAKEDKPEQPEGESL